MADGVGVRGCEAVRSVSNVLPPETVRNRTMELRAEVLNRLFRLVPDKVIGTMLLVMLFTTLAAFRREWRGETRDRIGYVLFMLMLSLGAVGGLLSNHALQDAGVVALLGLMVLVFRSDEFRSGVSQSSIVAGQATDDALELMTDN